MSLYFATYDIFIRHTHTNTFSANNFVGYSESTKLTLNFVENKIYKVIFFYMQVFPLLCTDKCEKNQIHIQSTNFVGVFVHESNWPKCVTLVF